MFANLFGYIRGIDAHNLLYRREKQSIFKVQQRRFAVGFIVCDEQTCGAEKRQRR